MNDLKIIFFPDPRLKAVSAPVETFDDSLRQLTVNMFALMREAKGVGLAAPQVGVNLRLFIMNHDQDPANDRVYINPVLFDGDGEEESEEGCLSLPKVHVDVWRSKTLRIKAVDLDGKPFEELETGYKARIWQHETDHLNGIMLTDKMGPVAKMTYRKTLRELEADYLEANPPPKKKR